MKGVTMERLKDRLNQGYEVEFTYKEGQYVIQKNGDKSHMFFTMWKNTPDVRCLSKIELPDDGAVPYEYIDFMLNDKCIDGKSFMELEKNIIIDLY